MTGPAKNLLELAGWSLRGGEDSPVRFSIAAYRRGDEPESAFVQTARAAGHTVDLIRERGRFDASVPERLREIVRLRDPDIIQTHNIKSHFFLRVSGIWRERTWLAFHHGFTNEDLRMRIYNLTSRWSFRAARQVVTVCGPFVDQLVARGVERDSIIVRPNSVRPFARPTEDELAAVRQEIGATHGTPILVAIGRLSREKGHADLLEAFARVRQRLAAHLVLVGEGGEKEALEQQRARLGLDGAVSLVGLKSDVRPYYALADVFVLPSHSEGSPNVLLEAMAAGNAIVATRVGGVPETVAHDDTALLVEPHDPGAMAEAIASVLENRELRERLGQRACQVAAEKYSPERYCESMVEMYRQVTKP